MSRQMALAVRVRNQEEAARRNKANLSVARFVLHRAVQPNGKRWLWYRMPSDLPHPRRDVSNADSGRRITGCNVERHGIRMHRPLRRRQFNFVEMRFTIWSGEDTQTLHAVSSFWCTMPGRTVLIMKKRGPPQGWCESRFLAQLSSRRAIRQFRPVFCHGLNRATS